MNLRDAEPAVFRDLEKMYRVIGYYEGQSIKPLEVHEKFVQQSLETNLRNVERYIRRIQYDLEINEAFTNKKLVYRTDRAESSLLYSLFSEGIQSLIVMREMDSVEVKDWITLVRETMLAFDRGENRDLASVLWRTPFRNLRARIYNALMDLEAESESTREKVQEGWHERDQDWDSPDAANVSREETAHAAVEPEEIRRLRQKLESLDGLSTQRLALDLSPSEIAMLSSEMGVYDQNHAEFNLASWGLSACQNSFGLDPHAQSFIEKLLKQLTQAIVSRFQPSLILFLISELKKLEGPNFSQLRQQLESTIAETLLKPTNEQKLLSSLKDSERAVTSKRLLPYLDPKQFPVIVQYYLEAKDQEGLVQFFKTMLERDLQFDRILFSWAPDLLAQVIPLFRRFLWTGKQEFLSRAVRSSHPKIVKAASLYLINLKLDPRHALEVYGRLEDETRELWVRNLLDNPPSTAWKGFVLEVLKSELWFKADTQILSSRLTLGWVSLAWHYFRENCLEVFKPWVCSRKWHFWAQFPKQREAIFFGASQNREFRANPEFVVWVESASKTWGNSLELKTLLKTLGAKS